jgi:hypothetical protein
MIKYNGNKPGQGYSPFVLVIGRLGIGYTSWGMPGWTQIWKRLWWRNK